MQKYAKNNNKNKLLYIFIYIIDLNTSQKK